MLMKKVAANRAKAVNERFQLLIRGMSSRTAGLIGVLVVSGLIGSYLLVSSHAATTAVSVEAEGGTKGTPATVVTDSTASAGKAVKFAAAQTPPPSTATMCTSKGDDLHDGYPNWDAVRVYQFGSVAKPISAGAKILAITDPGISNTGGQASADALDTQLGSFFQAHPNIEVEWGNDNEADRDITSSNAAAFANTYKLMRPVIDKYKNQGRKISMWVDLTQNNVSSSNDFEATIMQGVAPYLDGVAASMYPPSTTMADFPGFLDPIFALTKHWGIKRIAMWEGGSHVETDTSRTSIALTDVNGVKTTYHVSSYAQIRPLWTAYYAKYLVDAGVKNNLTVDVLCWWDGDTPGRATFFNHDVDTGANPRSVQTWRDWPSWIGKSM
jgi:hypothetical protein